MDFFKVSKSLIAIDNPNPKIGPINGEISIAPITTGIEFAFKPTDATKIEQIKIQAVGPLIDISFFMECRVAALSVSFLKSKISFKKNKVDDNKPFALPDIDLSEFFVDEFSSEKLNLFSINYICFKPVKSEELLILSPSPSVITILYF